MGFWWFVALLRLILPYPVLFKKLGGLPLEPVHDLAVLVDTVLKMTSNIRIYI